MSNRLQTIFNIYRGMSPIAYEQAHLENNQAVFLTILTPPNTKIKHSIVLEFIKGL